MAKIKATISNWSHSFISQAGHVVLLNSCIFSLPTYLLSCFFLPNSILDSIDKLVHNFLWDRNSNGGYFHSIGLHVVTLNKIEGGLGLHNLKNFGSWILIRTLPISINLFVKWLMF